MYLWYTCDFSKKTSIFPSPPSYVKFPQTIYNTRISTSQAANAISIIASTFLAYTYRIVKLIQESQIQAHICELCKKPRYVGALYVCMSCACFIPYTNTYTQKHMRKRFVKNGCCIALKEIPVLNSVDDERTQIYFWIGLLSSALLMCTRWKR